MDNTAYQAFISYSHAADGKLAPALQSGLQQFAKPWTRLRAMRVFRDKTGLAVTPGLWSSICSALDSSEYFLLLASPDAARSHWVDQEVRHWLSRPRAERLLIVLTGGNLAWDASSRRLDESRTDALPPSLREFAEEPLWLDLRWARSSEHISLQNPAWREAIADLSSTLRGIPKDQLIGEDVRQHARATWFRRAAIAGLTALAVGMAAAAWIAREQARIALARQLAAQAQLIRVQYPERLPLALLMAAEATQRHAESMETQQTLHAVLSSFPLQLATFEHSSGVMATALSPDLQLLATAAEQGGGALWRISQPGSSPVAKLEGADRRVLWSPDGKRIAGCCARVGVWSADGARQLDLAPKDLSGKPQSIAFSPDSRLLAIGVSDPRAGVVVFDIGSGREVFRHFIKMSSGGTRTGEAYAELAFAPNGNLAVALRDRVEMFSSAAWQRMQGWQLASGRVAGLAISPDGQHLAYASGTTVTVVDLKKGDQVASLGGDTDFGGNKYVGFSPDGRYLGVGQLDAGAIWEVESWREVVAVRHERFRSLSFDPAAAEAVSCGSGYCIGWSLDTGEEIHRFAHRYAHSGEDARAVLGGSFGARDSRFASGGGDRTARLWSLQPPAELARSRCAGERLDIWIPGRYWNMARGSLRPAPRPGCVQWAEVASPGGKYVSAVTPLNVVRVWETAGAAPVAEIQHTEPVDMVLALAPTAKYLATYRRDGALKIWDVRAVKVIQSEVLVQKSSPPALEFLSDTLMLRVDEADKVSVLNLPDGTPKWSVRLRGIRAVAISGDARIIAAAERDWSRPILRAWDAASGATLLERQVNERLRGLAFDPAGRYLLAAFGDDFPPGVGLRLWELASGREVLTVPEREKLIAIDFSADSTRLAAVSRDGNLELWDLPSGRSSSKTVVADPGPLAFSASGKWIAVGNRSIRILETAALRPIAQAEFTGDTRRIEFLEKDRILAADSAVDSSEVNDGIRQLRRWQPADIVTEACRRLPAAAAQGQWNQLYPERRAPTPCSP